MRSDEYNIAFSRRPGMTSRRRWHLSQRFVSVEIGTAPQARNEGTEIEMAVCREQQVVQSN